MGFPENWLAAPMNFAPLATPLLPSKPALRS